MSLVGSTRHGKNQCSRKIATALFSRCKPLVARMSSAGGESATYFTEPPDFHISPRALHSQECFLPLRGGFNLRCTRERDIPKNVFFLGEEVLIYDAPVYHAKITVSTKNFPRSEGRKCGVKGLMDSANIQWRKGSRPRKMVSISGMA